MSERHREEERRTLDLGKSIEMAVKAVIGGAAATKVEVPYLAE